MAPYTNLPLSPAELSYLHTSLTQSPPIRPDGRSPTQFRPLIAESDILPSANGSARICFADGTEAIVGVKAEVEKTPSAFSSYHASDATGEEHSQGVLGLGKGSGRDVEDDDDRMEEDVADGSGSEGKGKGRDEWVEVAIDVPGMRDDDALPVFLSAMLTEALLADGGLKDRLWINRRFHWRLYIDILLLSQPLSYPLPLLSLTTHLALLSTRLPALVSERDEDPLFNDDWEASTFLYPKTSSSSPSSSSSTTTTTTTTTTGACSPPPITLLVVSISPSPTSSGGAANNSTILFDPSREELAVADAVVAISLGVLPPSSSSSSAPSSSSSSSSSSATTNPNLRLLALRTIDPPSRLTSAGVPDGLNTTTTGTPGNNGTAGGNSAGGEVVGGQDLAALKERVRGGGSGTGGAGGTGTGGAGGGDGGKDSVWYPPRGGGLKRGSIARILRLCVEGDGTTRGVGWEVLEGLAGVVGGVGGVR